MEKFELINNEIYISSLFKNLFRKKNSPIILSVKDKQYIASLSFTARKGSDPSIIVTDGGIDIESGEEVTVFLYDQELAVFFKTAAIGRCIGSAFDIEKPDMVYASFRRLMQRYKFSDCQEAAIEFEYDKKEKRLVDISADGLSFISEDKNFEIGDLINHALIVIDGSFRQHINGRVIYLEQYNKDLYKYGIKFENMNYAVLDRLFQLISKKIRPNVEYLKNENVNVLEKVLQESLYDPGSGYQENAESATSALNEIKDKNLIFSGFSYNENDKCLAFGTALRVYNRTFLGQQAFCSREAKFDSSPWTQVYSGLADHLFINPGFENYIMYISKSNEWQAETVSDIERIIDDRNKCILDTFKCFTCDTLRLIDSSKKSEYSCEASEDAESFIQYCGRKLDPLIIKAYNYSGDDFFLKEIRTIYKSEGYFTERKLFRIGKDSETIAFAVAETSSDELGFNRLKDICRMYPVKEDADMEEVLKASLAAIAGFFNEYGKRSFRILASFTGQLAESLGFSGVEFEDELRRIVLSCMGLVKFKKLLAENFIDFKKYYRLTYPQMEIWNTEKVFPGTSFGNVVVAPYLKGELDFDLLEKAINLVVRKNEGLRIRIVEDKQTVKQYISKYEYFKVEFLDFTRAGGEAAYQNWNRHKAREPFKLVDSDLFYFAVFKISENEYGIYIKVHHAISDGWSIVTQASRIVEYYSMLKHGMEVSTKSEPSYIDFIVSEEEYLNSDKYKADMKFWSEKFNTVPELFKLKPSGIAYKNIKAARKTFILTKELTARIFQFCDKNRCSPFVVFLSVLYTYIGRITSKSDIVIGTPVLNRSNVREKNMAGMFVSLIPVRFNVDSSQDFITFVNALSKEWAVLLRHQKYPCSMIQKEFREKHGINDTLFDLVLSYQNFKLEMTELTGEYKLAQPPNGNQTDSLQIHINDRECAGEYVVDFDYLVDVFSEQEIDRMGGHFINLLYSAMDNPESALCDLNILPETEKKQLLYDFNNTDADYPKDKTLHELIEAHAKGEFNNTAVEFDHNKLSYRELNDKADALAFELRERGIGPNSIVGIMMNRSLDLIIGILGILKAGGAYLPINPNYPAARVNYILKDSGARILLVKGKLKGDVSFEGSILDLEENELPDLGDLEGLKNINSSGDLAYVIYTSGSTGEPKGTMIEHRSLINFLYSMYRMYDGRFSAQDRCLSLSNISFDASVCEIFMALVFGACVVLHDDSGYLDVVRLSRIITDKAISFTYIPPSLLMDLAQLLKKSSGMVELNKLFVGAEPIKVNVLDEYMRLNPSMKIINGYGPTEATIAATFYLFASGEDKESYVIIGKPLQNTRIYILDKNMMPVPVNVTGEIYIAGDGVGRGYLNRPELTAEKFLNNPFRPGRMYKSGDLARWLPDGNIQFAGRADNQVKIRGLRIELGEIESQLARIQYVDGAVVVVREEESGIKYLCGYFTSARKLNISNVKAQLLKVMPEYMIPKYLMQIDEMPLTYNGKVDKKLLPEPNLQNEESRSFSSPSNEVEEKLAKAWQEVLNIRRIGMDDSFFEYGADSLAIMRVLVEVLEYGWNISMQDFYENQTIRELSNKIIGNSLVDTYKETAAANCPITLCNKMEGVSTGERKEMKNVLLTGASGFLGVHVLKNLVENTGADVFCLIRGESENNSLDRLLEKLEFYFGKTLNGLINQRIFILNGDVTCDRLGLDLEKYTDLCREIDTVIHTAALVKHFGDYSIFEKVNVLGTRNIIEFCTTSGAKLNHVSTISISGDLFKQKESGLKFTENDLYVGQSMGDNVYVKSKFEAEKLIFEAAKSGLNASIFRIGNIAGRYCDGHFQSNIDENRFYNMLKFFIQLEVVSSDIYNWDMEITPVDLCAEAVLKLAELEGNNLNVYHLFNHNKVEMKEVMHVFNSCGCNMKLVDDSQYKSRIECILRSKDKKEMMIKVVNELGGDDTSHFIPSVDVSSEITERCLRSSGFEWPDIDAGYLRKIYDYMYKVGFISYIR